MDPILFAGFLTATLLLVASPGPSCALASSQAIKHGKRAAVLCVLGDALGTVVHITIAVISLKALIGAAAIVLPFLQIAGGGFILYLAYKSYFGAKHEPETVVLTADRSAFLAGFFACVTNPKAIVFFVALFPGFISPDLHIGVQTLVYGTIFVLLDAASILGYATLARYLVNSHLAPRVDIDKISGLGLGAVGLLLVFKGYKSLPST